MQNSSGETRKRRGNREKLGELKDFDAFFSGSVNFGTILSDIFIFIVIEARFFSSFDWSPDYFAFSHV